MIIIIRMTLSVLWHDENQEARIEEMIQYRAVLVFN